METIRRLEIEADCRQLTSSFFYHADRGNFDLVAELFDADGLFDRFGDVLHGREEIETKMATRPPGVISRHAFLNIYFAKVGEDLSTATVDALALFGFATDDVPIPAQAIESPRVVQFEDTYRNVDGIWKIQRRVGQVVLSGR